MQSTTVISLLTVGVSVASVIANLYIARTSRRTNLEVLEFKASLDRADVSAKLIRELETESERLRIRGYELISQIGKVHRHSEAPAQYESALKAVIESGLKFSEQARAFLDKWATAKGEFSEEQCNLLSKLRHECRGAIDDCVARLTSLTRVSKSREKALKWLDDIEIDVRNLLSLVQHFIVDVSNVRKAMRATRS